MVAIINYGLGNLRSVSGALQRLKVEHQITSDPELIRRAKRLILPGVGAFADGMKNICKLGLKDVIREVVQERGTPLLGICLGYQLLFERGFEFEETEGLSLVGGVVPKLDVKGLNLRVPHVGWEAIQKRNGSKIFDGIVEGDCFYFVHSYHAVPSNPEVITSTITYGAEVVASIQFGGIVGTQFHPEKSQRAGLKFLENFITKELCG